MPTIVQWVGIGLLTAAIAVPAVRWFWIRFDRPSEEAVRAEEERVRAERDHQLWLQEEARAAEERAIAEELARKRKEHVAWQQAPDAMAREAAFSTLLPSSSEPEAPTGHPFGDASTETDEAREMRARILSLPSAPTLPPVPHASSPEVVQEDISGV